MPRPTLAQASNPGIGIGNNGSVHRQVTMPTPSPSVQVIGQWIGAVTEEAAEPTPTLESTPGVRMSGPQSLEIEGEQIEVLPAGQGRTRWEIPHAQAGWHTDSEDCGAGVTTIGGHVSTSVGAGVFASLPTISEGVQVTCTNRVGDISAWTPVDYVLASATDNVRSWYPEWEPALILYTCTPELDGQLIVVRFTLSQQEEN